MQYQASFDPYGDPFEQFGSQTASALGFTGEQTDPNGLLFLQARYYHPGLGTFLSLDPKEGAAGDAMSFNRYAYAAANPVNLTDPSGLDPDELFPFLDPLRHTIRSGLAALPSLETVAGVVAAANEKLRQRLMGECASTRKLKAAFDNGYFAVRAVKISAEVVGTAALAVEGGLAVLEVAGGASLGGTLLNMLPFYNELADIELSAPIQIGKFKLPGLFSAGEGVAAGEEVSGLLGAGEEVAAGQGAEGLLNPGEVEGPFQSTRDPLADILGPGLESHPEEVEDMLQHMQEWGVEIRYQDSGRMTYTPAMNGYPGQLVISQESSIGAWRHEYQHFLDDLAREFPGPRVLYQPDVAYEFEFNAYMREVNLAREIGRNGNPEGFSAARQLLQQLRDDRMKYLGY